MFTPQSLFIDALWVLGLAGVLATISYMSWYRSLRRWSWRYTLALPRLLSPLSLSLALFCGGLALNGATNQSSSWWQTAAWSILTILFLVQWGSATQAGRQKGWDTPIGGTE